MKPLKTVYWLLTWQCMNPPEQSESVQKRIVYVGVALSNSIVIFYYAITSFIVFIEFLPIDMKVSLFAFMACFASLDLLYTLINAFILRYKTNEIFERLSAIYSESMEHIFRCLNLKSNLNQKLLFVNFVIN